MIIALLAPLLMAAATAPPDANPRFDPAALAKCMAFVAQGADYSGVSDDALAQDPTYLDDVAGACSDEVMGLWDEAHRRAYVKLGLRVGTAFGDMTREQMRRAVGEGKESERQLLVIISEHWPDARALRHQTLSFAPARMAKFDEAAMLGKADTSPQDRDAFAAIMDKPVACIHAVIKQGKILLGNSDIAALMAGHPGAGYQHYSISCGFPAAADALVARARNRFPAADPVLAQGVAESMLNQFVFWSLTGQQ